MLDGTILKGEFVNNYPEGNCKITYVNGSVYEGNVKKGIIDGIGELRETDGSCYKGNFKNGIKQGLGKFYISPEVGGTYVLEGQFENGEPSITANVMHF
jgi:hypothetical protein